MSESYIDRWVGENNPTKIHAWTLLHDVTTDLHILSCYLLVYVMDGYALHICDKIPNILKAGSMFLIRPGQGHIYTHLSNLYIYNCVFEPYMIDDTIREELCQAGMDGLLNGTNPTMEVLHVPLNEQMQITHILKRIAERRNKKEDLYALLRLYASINSQKTIENATVDGAKQYLLQALEYLKAHYTEKIQTSDIADYVGLNKDYMNRIFKKEFGMTISEYWITLRMTQAVEYLSKSNLPVAAIADKTGYHDFSLFSAHFKKVCKMSPNAYRTHAKNNLFND